GGKLQKARTEAGVAVLPKAECEPKRFIREFRTDGEEQGCQVGQSLTVSVFDNASHIDVIGTTKGRGTAGVMKRHNFSGQGAAHGVKRVHRHGGSIGSSADPSRVLKGTKMTGRYGHSRVTIRHLKVVRIDAENNMVLVRGGIPGPNGSFVILRHANKK
ncbi:MAG: 50S ribosomal protein L3, partial [Planctomycetaceae bacterium]